MKDDNFFWALKPASTEKKKIPDTQLYGAIGFGVLNDQISEKNGQEPLLLNQKPVASYLISLDFFFFMIHRPSMSMLKVGGVVS